MHFGLHLVGPLRVKAELEVSAQCKAPLGLVPVRAVYYAGISYLWIDLCDKWPVEI